MNCSPVRNTSYSMIPVLSRPINTILIDKVLEVFMFLYLVIADQNDKAINLINENQISSAVKLLKHCEKKLEVN